MLAIIYKYYSYFKLLRINNKVAKNKQLAFLTFPKFFQLITELWKAESIIGFVNLYTFYKNFFYIFNFKKFVVYINQRGSYNMSKHLSIRNYYFFFCQNNCHHRSNDKIDYSK